MISDIFIDRPRLAFVVSIVITLAGIIAMAEIPVAQFPDIVPPQVSLTTLYPGVEIDGAMVPARPYLGVYTQPLSFIGLPIVAAPLRKPGELPIGVQIIAAPWREADALRAAWALERDGVTCATPSEA
jgi:Asp-tRNA(Asn)/Glu-tRNA(Gln) amidotransferase A subunit family amidase